MFKESLQNEFLLAKKNKYVLMNWRRTDNVCGRLNTRFCAKNKQEQKLLYRHFTSKQRSCNYKNSYDVTRCSLEIK